MSAALLSCVPKESMPLCTFFFIVVKYNMEFTIFMYMVQQS